VRDKGNRLLDDMVGDRGLAEWGLFEPSRLRWMLDELRAGGREADAGLFFRVAVLGLWLGSLKRARC